MRKCKDCQQEKEESEFYKCRGRLLWDCKTCFQAKRKGYSNKWYDKNKEKRREIDRKRRERLTDEDKAKKAEYAKKYREKNSDKLKKRSSEYREKNRNKINQQVKELYKKNKDKYSQAQKKYQEEHKEEIKEQKRKDRENNPEKYRLLYQKNKEKSIASRKKWGKENKDKVKELKRKAYLKLKVEQPQKYALRSVRSVISALGKGKKLRRSLEYIGVSDHFEFVSLLSLKTEHSDWYVRDDYHVDHIWQVNWCDNFLLRSSTEAIEGALHCLNHHSNLRPLLGLENLTRSHYDFSPLNKDDYQKFEPFLDERIKVGLKFYWENPELFSGKSFKRGSEEEKLIIDHVRSQGVEP